MRPVEVHKILGIPPDKCRADNQTVKAVDRLVRYDPKCPSSSFDLGWNTSFEHAVKHPIHVRPQARRRQLTGGILRTIAFIRTYWVGTIRT
jgi:hypothetical protein